MSDGPFTFDFDGSVLGKGSAEQIVVATATSDVAKALASDELAFPERTIALGDFVVKAKGGKDIAFGGDGKSVSFQASGEVKAGLLITPEREVLLEHLPVAESIADGLREGDDEGISYALLRSVYHFQVAAKGSLALGAGTSAVLGADGKSDGGFAVVQRFEPRTPARQVLRDTVAAWRLPRQVRTVDELAPGTWLVAEVDGGLALSLGVKAGYDFSWVRDTALAGLTGDIALRVQAGLSATLEFEASGRYALVLRRDSLKTTDRRLRLQLFKQRKQGWSFALEAKAHFQGDVSDFAPASLDELLRAVLGVHGAQILDQLGELTDPDKSLGEVLAGAGVERAKKLLADVTGVDVESELEAARGRITELLETWQDLDGRVASAIWETLGVSDEIDDIRTLAGEIKATLADDGALRGLLSERLGSSAFLSTAAGRWLESVATEGVLPLATTSSGLLSLRKAAEATLDVLDDGPVETLVGKLKTEIERVFRLDRVEASLRAAVKASDPAKLDAWLEKRLAQFLDARPTVPRLQQILDAIEAIRQRGEDFYQRTLQAIQRRYQLSFAATYRKTTTKEALVDVELDFDGGESAETLGALLREVIDGDFRRLLVASFDGVTLHGATLTHQIDRQAHVELSLPWYDRETKNIARSLAKVSAVEDDGRLLLYDGSANDEVATTTAKTRRDSQLSVLLHLPVRPGQPGPRVHQRGTMTCSYSFRQALAETRTAALGTQLDRFVGQYFQGEFPAYGDGRTGGSVADWLAALDRRLEEVQHNGQGNLGNTLLNLQVSLGEELAGAWLNAPPAGDPAYEQMSIRIQTVLKRLIPWVYFQDPDRYRAGDPRAACLLAYQALPPLTDVRVDGDQLVPQESGDLYWAINDHPTLVGLLEHRWTGQRLGQIGAEIGAVLSGIPALQHRAKDFLHPHGFAQLVHSGLFESDGRVRPLLMALLASERDLVQAAARAGAKMATFRALAGTDPADATKALAELGDLMTRAFHKRVKNAYLKHSLRPFGTLLFAEAAAALGGLPAETSAFLQLAILAPGAELPAAEDLAAYRPEEDDILLEQHLVSIPRPS